MDHDERNVRAFLGRSYERHLAKAHHEGLLREVPALEPHEAAAILWYTGNSSVNWLRRLYERKERKQDLALATVLARAFSKLPLCVDDQVYRVITVGEADLPEFRRKYTSREHDVWHAFSSCSRTSAPRKDGNVLFLVRQVGGRLIGKFSWYPEEQEVVLLPGFHFAIRSYVTPEPGVIEIEIEERT